MSAYLYAVTAYVIWGTTPLYWKLFSHIPVLHIAGHRMVWALFSLTLCLAISEKKMIPSLPKISAKKWLLVFFSAVAIGLNWYLYVYSVLSHHLMDASFGYFINPLMTVGIARIFLGEHLRSLQIVAILFALVGVFYLSFHLHGFPLLSLSLASTFAVYGLFKKIVGIHPLKSTWLETLFLLVPGLILLWPSIFVLSLSDWLGMAFGGAITALPLVLFSKASQVVPLNHMGFLQYLSPSLKLILAACLFHEAFDRAHQASFILIWIGLAFFTYDLIKLKKA